jgi:ABC-type sugar transport system permease subunit
MNVRNRRLALSLLVLPGLLLYGSLVLYPTARAFYLSLFQWQGLSAKTFVGLANYQYLFDSRIFRSSLLTTLNYMLVNVPVQICSAYVLAYLLYTGVKGLRFFRFLFFLPCVLLSVAVGYIFDLLLNPWFGLLRPIATLLGVQFASPLGTPALALYAVIFVDWWQWLGYKIMLFFAGFQNMSPEVLEAAAIDGASATNTFFRVVIPLSWETLAMVTIMLVIGSLRVFDLIFIMTQGGPNHATEVLTLHMFITAFEKLNFGAGSAIAVVLFIISLTITIVVRTALRREVY